MGNCLSRSGEIEARSLFQNGQLSMKNCEIEAHSSFQNEQLSTKINEVEAHSSFKNVYFLTTQFSSDFRHKIGELEARSHALLI